MDIIYLHDLKIDCVLGIWEWERRTTQTLTIDLDMGADVRKAAASGRIEDTVDYKTIAKRLIGFVGESQFGLVETLAEKIADIVLTEFPVHQRSLCAPLSCAPKRGRGCQRGCARPCTSGACTTPDGRARRVSEA